MKVTTEIRRIDLFKVNIYRQFRTKFIWAWMAFLAGFLCLSFTSRNSPSEVLPWVIVIIGSCIFVVIVHVVLLTIILTLKYLFSSGEMSGITGTHVYSLSVAGVHESTIANHGFSKWSSIQSVVRTSSYIYIKLNSDLFHIIPRRAFCSDLEYNEFWRTAHDYWRQAEKQTALQQEPTFEKKKPVTQGPACVCCFCGNSIAHTEYEPIEIAVNFKDGMGMGFCAHVDCMGRTLDVTMPFLTLEELASDGE